MRRTPSFCASILSILAWTAASLVSRHISRPLVGTTRTLLSGAVISELQGLPLLLPQRQHRHVLIKKASALRGPLLVNVMGQARIGSEPMSVHTSICMLCAVDLSSTHVYSVAIHLCQLSRGSCISARMSVHISMSMPMSLNTCLCPCLNHMSVCMSVCMPMQCKCAHVSCTQHTAFV